MGWFDEQLKYRKQQDNENFEDAIAGLAGAVVGRRLTEALSDQAIAQSAMEEILKFYHLKIKTDDFPATVKTLEDRLEYRFRPFGIMRRTVELEKGWYQCAVGPLLGTKKEDGAAVALIPGKLSGYYFLDPATGTKTKVTRKNEDLLDSEAICFYKPLPLKALKVTDLLKFMAEQLSLSDILLYLGLMAASTALGFLSPLFSQWLFGSVLESGSLQVLLALAVFMASFALSQQLMFIYQSLVSERINVKQDVAVQAAVMNRLMSLPPRFFRQYAAGDLTQRAMYIRAFCSVMMNTVGTMGLMSVFSLAYIGQIFALTPSLVVPSLFITLFTVVLSLVTTLWQTKISKESMKLSSETSGMTYAMLAGIQKIKLAGAEKRMFSRWARQYSKEAALIYNPPTFLKLSEAITAAISTIGSLVLFAVAIESEISVADYYAFNTAYGLVSGAFMGLASVATTVASLKPTLEMVKPILEAEPELTEGKEVVTQLRGAIELNNVSFRYEDDTPYILDNLSLKIQPGEYLAVVGSTGCGKSTLMRLLLGFEKPQKGAIYFDRKDISKVDLKSLRRKIGAVTQDGKLFLGDIYSNIVIAAPQLTVDDAWEAAEIASIADDIRAMPMGMNTIICEGQGGISGGQRQRLMIARAIAPRPKVLMFDEATSALDNVTQRKVSEAIDSLQCTRIIIAHRLSTIRHCDRIIVLDKGHIVEDGTYEELIEKNGFFAELVARQRLDVGDDP